MWRWIPSPITFFTAVLAFFTVVLAISTSIQVWAFIESERAFVNIDIVGVEMGKISEGRPVILNLSVRNSGRETAFMEEAVISYQLGALPPEPHYARGDIKFVGPVPPGETFAGAFTPLRDGSTMKFDASEMALVNSGKNLFFFGYARYRDPFSPLLGTRMIGFCRQYNPNNPPGLVVFEGCGAVGAKYVYLRP
jgi:hypothetical protein